VLGVLQSDLESLEMMTGSKDRAAEVSDHRCESVATLFDLNVFQIKGEMQSFVPTLWLSIPKINYFAPSHADLP
jgi:hypothetical protein